MVDCPNYSASLERMDMLLEASRDIVVVTIMANRVVVGSLY